MQTIHFPAGKSSATLHSGLVRGEADFYAITARQGQTGDIVVKSLEDNASLPDLPAAAKPVTGQDGLDIDGPVLPGGDAAPGLDEGATRHWHGALPASGTYYIVVSRRRPRQRHLRPDGVDPLELGAGRVGDAFLGEAGLAAPNSFLSAAVASQVLRRRSGTSSWKLVIAAPASFLPAAVAAQLSA